MIIIRELQEIFHKKEKERFKSFADFSFKGNINFKQAIQMHTDRSTDDDHSVDVYFISPWKQSHLPKNKRGQQLTDVHDGLG